jgi:ribosomal protein L40E
MALEYHTVNFTNDGRGIAQKNAYTNQMSAQGWRVTNEAIEGGHIKGGEACCGFAVCMPLAFLAGRTPGIIVTTFAREYSICSFCGVRQPANAVFCGSCGASVSGGSKPKIGEKVCPTCGWHESPTASAESPAFCSNCGTQFLRLR